MNKLRAWLIWLAFVALPGSLPAAAADHRPAERPQQVVQSGHFAVSGAFSADGVSDEATQFGQGLLFQGDAEKAAFEVLLPADDSAQTETLLAATIKAMAGK